MDQSIRTLTEMGWYLDTSLFMDFIQRNIRKGFDTAEEHNGKTIMSVRGLSGARSYVFAPVMARGRRFAFELTKTVNMLRILHWTNGTRYYYCELTKAEVFRALRKAHPSREKAEIVAWWEAFVFLLCEYQKLELDFHVGEQFSMLALDFPIHKNAQDYLHVIAAKEKGLAFITCDKLDGQIEDLKKNYYPHIYFWPDISGRFFDDEAKRFWNLNGENRT